MKESRKGKRGKSKKEGEDKGRTLIIEDRKGRETSKGTAKRIKERKKGRMK